MTDENTEFNPHASSDPDNPYEKKATPVAPPGQEPADTPQSTDPNLSMEEQVEAVEDSRMPAGTLDDTDQEQTTSTELEERADDMVLSGDAPEQVQDEEPIALAMGDENDIVLAPGFEMKMQVPAYDVLGRTLLISLAGDVDYEEVATNIVDSAVYYLSRLTKSQIRDGTLVLSAGSISSECSTYISREDLTTLVESFLQNALESLNGEGTL